MNTKDKYDIDILSLEITRNCNLECMHCLRGDRVNTNISEETIENLFRDIHSIKTLLITGGEPLIAQRELDKIIDLIVEKNIKLDTVKIITNGTVLNSQVLKTLKKYMINTKFKLYISYDKFHYIELEKKALLEKKNKNLEIFRELFGARNIYDYSSKEDNNISLFKFGKAKNLTEEDLELINNYGQYKTNYTFSDSNFTTRVISKIPKKNKNKIEGYLNIAVNGNISPFGISYEDEDILLFGNINEDSIGNIVGKINKKFYEIKTKKMSLSLQKIKKIKDISIPKDYEY